MWPESICIIESSNNRRPLLASVASKGNGVGEGRGEVRRLKKLGRRSSSLTLAAEVHELRVVLLDRLRRRVDVTLVGAEGSLDRGTTDAGIQCHEGTCAVAQRGLNGIVEDLGRGAHAEPVGDVQHEGAQGSYPLLALLLAARANHVDGTQSLRRRRLLNSKHASLIACSDQRRTTQHDLAFLRGLILIRVILQDCGVMCAQRRQR
mmetsp:Transcript_89481/g.255561  ORF Transcript_89481/g.255561 Transcript_89481/m.255561 type:complete len:206 (-) Transcript_89481:652-1269(-)